MELNKRGGGVNNNIDVYKKDIGDVSSSNEKV